MPVYTHTAKEKLPRDYYSSLLGMADSITIGSELPSLMPPVASLATLEEEITESEAKVSLCAAMDALALPVECCIPGWRVYLLNRAGRLILVNSVMSAKPLHAMVTL
ncbi:hypothetical protein C2845_PM12G08770 [Panicum miliaceum]|uniref:Uncharacterized protein n=1 Tax=Panicum miliaceum TaxID=4540 RepID=A0A3L6QMJ9_PANMI|nr:hypothetical protein C2845_PM12G08770 [Panicum miliaceum]